MLHHSDNSIMVKTKRQNRLFGPLPLPNFSICSVIFYFSQFSSLCFKLRTIWSFIFFNLVPYVSNFFQFGFQITVLSHNWQKMLMWHNTRQIHMCARLALFVLQQHFLSDMWQNSDMGTKIENNLKYKGLNWEKYKARNQIKNDLKYKQPNWKIGKGD